ncbi:MAG: hypothetical protein ACE5G3_02660 [Gammaproteobacteria bacterium]
MNSRREFLKKASYIAPTIVSLPAIPSFANAGSNRPNTAPFPGSRLPCANSTELEPPFNPDTTRVKICGD